MSTKTAQIKGPTRDPAQEDKVDRYLRAMSKAIQEGAKYRDLMNMKPSDYGLPDKYRTWESRKAGAKFNYTPGPEADTLHTVILRAIAKEFSLDLPQPLDLTRLPGLWAVADEMGAPYSVIMEAYKLNKTEDEQKVSYLGPLTTA